MKDTRLIRFLRKPRFYTTDREKVTRQSFQWVPVSLLDESTEVNLLVGMNLKEIPDARWYLSFFGLINGPLPKYFGVVLTAWMSDNPKGRWKLKIMKKPW